MGQGDGNLVPFFVINSNQVYFSKLCEKGLENICRIKIFVVNRNITCGRKRKMDDNRAKKMYDYHVWANQKLFQHLKQLPERLYKEQINSVFSSISDVMVHLYATDVTWLETMKGSSYQDTVSTVNRRKQEASEISIDELEGLYRSLSEEYYRFFAEQQDSEQIIITEHPRFGRTEFVLADLIHHVVNHGTYHRGNISAMLHQQGERGIPTDYVYFLFK